jgi:hypothetical protein
LCVGGSSGYNITTGARNITLGTNSGLGIVEGSDNINIGGGTNAFDKDGDRKVAVGFQAMGACIATQAGDSGLTAIGSQAMANYVGKNSTALGSRAMESGQFGDSVTLVGANTGLAQPDLSTTISVTQSGNVLTGDFSTFGVTGDFVSCFTNAGNSVIIKITSPTTAEGVGRGDGNNIGTGITDLTLSNKRGITNSSALGFEANPTASNQVMLGNGATTAVVSTGTFTTISDESLKHEISAPSHSSLDRLSAFEPKDWKFCREKCLLNNDDPENPKYKLGLADCCFDVEHFGYIAQEVQTVIPQAAIDIGEGLLGVSYEKLIPDLHRAILELKAENQALKARLDSANL